MKELKDCPFCGNDGYLLEHQKGGGVQADWSIKCPTCGAYMQHENDEMLIFTWNLRHTDDIEKEKLDKFKY